MQTFTIIAFILGFICGTLSVVAYGAYHYYKAWKEAHEEGWDLPS